VTAAIRLRMTRTLSSARGRARHADRGAASDA
jgi:hypothetical protein